MSQLESSGELQISEQSFLDLCTWLSDDKPHSAEQLSRLLNENHYLNLMELANTYWLTGHLTSQFKKQGIWPLLPDQLTSYLTTLDDVYSQRSEAIHQEVIDVCDLLAPITPQLVLLKGSAALFNGIAEPISTRYMADIDILVPAEKLDMCLDTLVTNGYALDINDVSISTTDFHHAPPAIRKNGPCYIELHRRPLVNSLTNILCSQEALSTAISLPLTDDLLVQQMHPTQQLIHTIAHSELQDKGFDEAHIDLRQLLNFYLIAKRFAPQICWRTVEQRFVSTAHSDVLNATVFHANNLFGLPIYIQNFEQTKGQSQYLSSIQNFTKTELSPESMESIRSVLQGYSKVTIINLYGSKGHFPILIGRLKHFKRHLIMLLKGNRP